VKSTAAALLVLVAWIVPTGGAGAQNVSCPAAPGGFEEGISNQGVATAVPGSENATFFVTCNYFRPGEPEAFQVGSRWDEAGPSSSQPQTECGLPPNESTAPVSGYEYSQERAAHVSFTVTTGTGPPPAELRAMALVLLAPAEARAVPCVVPEGADDAGGGGDDDGGDDGDGDGDGSDEAAGASGDGDGDGGGSKVPVIAIVGGVVVLVVGGVIVARLGKPRR
jgi:hypothetical protein